MLLCYSAIEPIFVCFKIETLKSDLLLPNVFIDYFKHIRERAGHVYWHSRLTADTYKVILLKSHIYICTAVSQDQTRGPLELLQKYRGT